MSYRTLISTLPNITAERPGETHQALIILCSHFETNSSHSNSTTGLLLALTNHGFLISAGSTWRPRRRGVRRSPSSRNSGGSKCSHQWERLRTRGKEFPRVCLVLYLVSGVALGPSSSVKERACTAHVPPSSSIQSASQPRLGIDSRTTMEHADTSHTPVRGSAPEGVRFWITSCRHVVCGKHTRKLLPSFGTRRDISS